MLKMRSKSASVVALTGFGEHDPGVVDQDVQPGQNARWPCQTTGRSPDPSHISLDGERGAAFRLDAPDNLLGLIRMRGIVDDDRGARFGQPFRNGPADAA